MRYCCSDNLSRYATSAECRGCLKNRQDILSVSPLTVVISFTRHGLCKRGLVSSPRLYGPTRDDLSRIR